jgi:nickel/cobalt transporter (NicO) family protein
VKRRLPAVLGMAVGLFGAMALIGGPVATAHPLGNFTINRYSGLVVSTGNIEVRYVLDLAEIPTFQETPAIDTDGDGTVDPAERRAWSDRKAGQILANLALAVDGVPVALRVVSDSMRLRPGQAGLPTLYFAATFRGALGGRSGQVRYSDANFPGRIGWREVTASSSEGVALANSTVPASSVSRGLLAYPKDLLSSPPDVASATFAFHPGRPTAGSAGSGGETVIGSPVASGGSFAGLVNRRLTPLVLALSLLLAFGFGAVHALGPGHGKTITAAYLVGQGARAGQAAAVGVAVALMHTASVLALGLVLFVLARSFPADRVYPWLTLGTGLVALGLGAGLLVVRVRARRKGSDPWHGHSHPPGDRRHGHSHDPDEPHAGSGVRPISGRGLVALALAGGILPSPTAFVVLTGAVVAHRVGYGLALIFAFSLGLAASLVVVGLLALRARAVMSSRLTGRWMGLVPILSALVIVGFGLFFATRGLAQLS